MFETCKISSQIAKERALRKTTRTIYAMKIDYKENRGNVRISFLPLPLPPTRWGSLGLRWERALKEKAENTEIKAMWTWVGGGGTNGEEGLAGALTITSFREVHGIQATSYRPSHNLGGQKSCFGRYPPCIGEWFPIILHTFHNNGPAEVLLINNLRFNEPHPNGSVCKLPSIN